MEDFVLNYVFGIPSSMARLTPITPQPVRGQVYETLEQAIVDCTLEPDTVLRDRQLAEELGVSRTPVREALHLLESSGLVQRHGPKGWVVASLEVRDVEELFELRCLLEPVGLSRVVTWGSDWLGQLVSMFDEFSAPMSTRRVARYLQRDAEFHHALVAASQNRRIERIYEVVERQVDRCRHFISYRYEGRVDQSLEEHREICRALKRRDADAAAELLVGHICAARDKHIAIVESSPTRRKAQ